MSDHLALPPRYEHDATMLLKQKAEIRPRNASIMPPQIVSVRKMEIDYLKYRRLLAAALARLAKTGYVIPPHEGLDLIHDFFVEEWNGLQERYNPSMASLDTYIFGAFVRFARPRIVRLNRLRDGLVEPQALITLAISDPRNEERITGADTIAVRRAVNRLPPAERNLLAAYISDDRPSERELAGCLGISRYDLRLKLADALGRFAIELGGTDAWDPRAAAVARALWRDNRNVRETADLLRLATAEVQAVRFALFKQLLRAVRGEKSMTDTASDQDKGFKHPPAGELLAAALSSHASAADFDALRENSDAVWQFLDGPEANTFIFDSEYMHPQQIEEIYVALAGRIARIDDDPDYNAFIQASIFDDVMIGEAFCSVLMPSLRADLRKFKDVVFFGAPKVSDEYVSCLIDEPSVPRGEAYAHELAEFGITPALIMETTRAISNLALRTCRNVGGKVYINLIIGRSGEVQTGHNEPVLLLRETAVAEVCLATQLPQETSIRLFDWLCDVAEYIPHLFDGFECALKGDVLHLIYTGVKEEDLFQRLRPGQSASVAASRSAII